MKWADLTETELRDKLPESNGNFQLVCSYLNLLPVAATVKDALGRVLYANRVAMKLYGRKPNEILGSTIDRILQLDEPAIIRDIRRVEKRVLSSGRAEIHFQQLGSRVHPVRHSVLKFPFFDSDGDPVLVSLIFPTTHKQLET